MIPDQSGQLFNDIGNFTLFNDPILPSKLNPKTDSIQSLLLPLIIQNTTAFPYGIQSLPPPSQLVADLCDEIIYTLENTFVCNDKKAGKKYLFNPADANLVPLNLDPLFAPTISPGSAYELVDGVLYCTLAYGSPL